MSAFTNHRNGDMMVKGDMDTRINAIASWKSGRYSAEEISQMYSISERTIRRWKASYETGGFESLKPQSTALEIRGGAPYEPLAARASLRKP